MLQKDITGQFKKQLPKNSFFQVLSFISKIVVGILLVPYLLHNIGSAAYGLIPLAGVMTQYAGLIAHNITISVNRYLTIALQDGDEKEANRVFNTAFFSYLAIVFIQIPIFLMIIFHANTLFSIPIGIFKDAIILLVCSAVSYLINLIASVFGVSLYANNRIDISRSIDMIRVILNANGIVILFSIFGPALRYVGYMNVCVSVSILVINVIVGKRMAPILKISYSYYEKNKTRELMSMGAWLLVNNVGTLLFMSTDIWICNRFIGPKEAGEYAALLQVPVLIREGGGILSAVIAPMVIIYYAKKEFDKLIRISKMSVRILSLLLTLPISILIIISPHLLRLWLGDEFVSLAPLMKLMLYHLVINIGVMPLFSIQIATNNVKLPGIVALFMGILNIILSIILAKHFGYGIYGIVIAGAILLTIKNAVWTPLYAASILSLPWYAFIRQYIPAVILLIALTVSGSLMEKILDPMILTGLYMKLITIFMFGTCAIWNMLSNEERLLIIEMIPGKLGKMIGSRLKIIVKG